MATIVKALIPGSILTIAAVVYYTVPVNSKTIIKQLTLTNTSALPVTYAVYLASGSGAPGVADNLIAGTLAPTGTTGSTVILGSANGHVLEAGDTIQALAGTASVVTIKGSGLEVI